MPVLDHPQRYALVNELHARPFPSLEVPCHAVYLVIKQPVAAASRDRAADRAQLIDLLDRHGCPHPPPDASHYSGTIGHHDLKWENHTEFTSYSTFRKGVAERPFDLARAEDFSDDWLARMPGTRLISLLIRVDVMPEVEADIPAMLEQWFVPASLAASKVIDGAAIVAGDFRIDSAGHMHFAVFVRPGTSPRRVGRIVQRLCEIETYRAMSMLGLARARELGDRLNALDPKLLDLVASIDSNPPHPEATLHNLLTISAELERLAVQSFFRFGATTAYEAILHQRIAALREARIEGRQTFAEFMMRRYDPAMRTVKSAEIRLHSMMDRARHAADLLRTRVDVDRSAQNQKLLESMDRRAGLALRLQHTVEGLSVVAISYYSVNLAAYLAYPGTEALGISKGMTTALLTPLVILAVWLTVRRIRRHMEH